MTPTDLESAIAEARRRMEDAYNHGERSEARKWAETLRDLVSERDSKKLSAKVEL